MSAQRFLVRYASYAQEWFLYDLRTCARVLLKKPLTKSNAATLRSYLKGSRLTAAQVLEFGKRIRIIDPDIAVFEPLHALDNFLDNGLGSGLETKMLQYQADMLADVFKPEYHPHIYQLVHDARDLLKSFHTEKEVWTDMEGPWHLEKLRHSMYSRVIKFKLTLGVYDHDPHVPPRSDEIVGALREMSGFSCWEVVRETTHATWRAYRLSLLIHYPTSQDPEASLVVA